jgi:uncharacterized protein (TIGR01777 family)
VKVAIVGSNGLIGAALARALVARGDSVVALSRSGAAGIGGALDMRWDPAEGPPPAAALDGADAVVNLAGVPIGGKRWTADRKREIHESRTLPTRLIVDAMAQEGAPPVLVNGSAVGYYGTTEDTVDETSPAGSDFLAETCVAWEREAVRAAEHAVRVVLVRTGIVLARDGGALPQMALPVKLFAGGPIGGGRQWIPWIHIDDEVGLLLLALDSADLSGPLNGCAPEPARQRDFVKALGSALGRPSILPTPAFPLRLAMGEMATLALEGQRAVPAVALAAGFEYVHPDLEAALRAIYA